MGKMGHNGTPMGHNTLGLREDWRGHAGMQHVGTRWDTTGHKMWDTNLGHKIWDTKFGTRNLGYENWGHKIWDTKMGDKGDTTPQLRIRDTLGYTTGHNGENGTQRDTTPYVYVRIGGDTFGYSTLGHVGTQNLAQFFVYKRKISGRKIWDTKFGTQDGT